MSYRATLVHGEHYVLMGTGMFRRGEPRPVSAAVRLQLEEQAIARVKGNDVCRFQFDDEAPPAPATDAAEGAERAGAGGSVAAAPAAEPVPQPAPIEELTLDG